MNHMIDLTSYLPAAEEQARADRRENHYNGLVAAVESIVTLAIGAGFFLIAAAFLSAL